MMQYAERNNIMKFYISYALSAFGFEFIMFVMTVHIYKLTQEAFSVGIFTALSLFPRIFSPYYGALIDRYAKNILLSAATFLCGLSIMILGHFKSIHHIYILWFVISVFIMFIKNVRVVLMTEVKEKDYLSGNAFILVASNVAKVLSPLIGGIITAYYNVTVMLYFIGTLYLSIAVTGLFIKTRTLKHSKVTLSVLKPVAEGLVYLFRRPVLTRLISTIICWRLFVGFQLSVFVVYIKSYLGMGDAQYGIFMTCLGLGSVAGSIIGPMVFKNQQNYQYTGLILGLHYFTLCILGVIHHFYLAAALIFISYFLFYVSLVGNHSARDLNTELPVRGRAYGSVFAITTPVGVLSMLVGSYLANIWGVHRVLFGGGVMALVSLCLMGAIFRYVNSRKQGEEVQSAV
jgi:MFS transporter, DHA3 family, macrolide efflux protein